MQLKSKVKITLPIFTKRANKAHNAFYDYSQTILGKTIKHNVDIICPIHGIFNQRAQNHLRGDRCPDCTGNKKLNNKSFIEKAQKIHGDEYDYSMINILNNMVPVSIICKIHGKFSQKPAKHLAGHGCQECGIHKGIISRQKTTDEFIERANIIHNYKYDYSLTIYLAAKKDIIIICPDHGEFSQSPDNHLHNHGCLKCSSSISKKETKWLDLMGITERNKWFKINDKKISVDGIDYTTNTVYEFNGDFWHGNPLLYNANEINPMNKITYGELYQNTIKKMKLLLGAGYNLVSIWELEFDKLHKAQ